MKHLITLSIFVLSLSFLVNGQQTLNFTIDVNGTTREYIVYAPAAYDGTSEWPAVLSFHSYYTLMTTWMNNYDIRPVADTSHFLLVYPQGEPVILNYNPSGYPNTGLGWNMEGGLTSSSLDDIDFIDALYTQIQTEFAIDSNRIYAYGHGLGGMFAQRVSTLLPNKFAAVASTAMFDTLQASQAIPTLLMEGTDNDYWPMEGVPGIYPSSQSIIENTLTSNACTMHPIIYQVPDTNLLDSSSVEVYDYVDCDGQNVLSYYKIIGGGYAMPGQVLMPGQEVFGPVNMDINANAEIWNFFSKHVRNHQPHPDLVEETINVNGTIRDYSLYIPEAYDGTQDWPLVVSFHPYYTYVSTWVRKYDIRPIADTAKFLIAFPEGKVVNMNLTGPYVPPSGLGWNLGGLAYSNNDDVAFAEAMLNEIKSNYQVDDERVYAYGLSLGAAMAHRMAILYPDMFAAVAAVAGYDTTQITDGFPMLFMHGTIDETMPLEGLPGFYPSLTSVMDAQLAISNCNLTPSTTAIPNSNYVDSSTVEVHEYLNCENNQEVVFYKILDGNHSYPGQMPFNVELFNGHINRDINAGAEIWKFFSKHTNSSTSEIESREQSNIDMNVYPNPISDHLNITFDNISVSPVSISIYNTMGAQVYQIDLSHLPSGQGLTLNGINLQNGIYILKLQSGASVSTKPIIVQR
jgi:polyhydroxybutyrate depolymerase